MANILKVSIVGDMPGGEKWTVNPCWRLNPPQLLSDTELTGIVTAVNAVSVPSGLRAVMNTTTLVSGARVEARDIGGDLEGVAEGARASIVAGSTGSGRPYQSALVISLMTVTPGGRGRGRLYWPATGVVLNGETLRVDPTVHTNFLAAAKTYLTDLTSAIELVLGTDADLCVWSRTGPNSPAVNQLRVGDIVDTQRRRRDALRESYQLVSFGV